VRKRILAGCVFILCAVGIQSAGAIELQLAGVKIDASALDVLKDFGTPAFIGASMGPADAIGLPAAPVKSPTPLVSRTRNQVSSFRIMWTRM
jgi:hypothetical protein